MIPITPDELRRLIASGKVAGADTTHLEAELKEWEEHPEEKARKLHESMQGLRNLDVGGGQIYSTAPLWPDDLLGIGCTLQELNDALEKAKQNGENISKLAPLLDAWKSRPNASLDTIIEALSQNHGS